jgi:hypothetical protein
VKSCFYFLQGQTQKSRKRKKKEEKTKKVTAKQRQFGTRAVPGWKESQEKCNVALESNACLTTTRHLLCHSEGHFTC